MGGRQTLVVRREGRCGGRREVSRSHDADATFLMSQFTEAILAMGIERFCYHNGLLGILSRTLPCTAALILYDSGTELENLCVFFVVLKIKRPWQCMCSSPGPLAWRALCLHPSAFLPVCGVHLQLDEYRCILFFQNNMYFIECLRSIIVQVCLVIEILSPVECLFLALAYVFFKIFIVIQLQLSAFRDVPIPAPHASQTHLPPLPPPSPLVLSMCPL